MKRILLIFLTALLLLPLLGGCKKTRTDDETVYKVKQTEYEVKWVLRTGIVTTRVKAGEMPVPPRGYDAPSQSNSKNYTFRSWDKELSPVTGPNTIYTAEYDSEYRLFDVTFIIDGVKTVVSTRYGEVPEVSDVPEGKYVFWDTIPEEITGSGAVFTGTLIDRRDDIEYLEWALRQEPMYYKLNRNNDNMGGALDSACALYYLVYVQRNETTPPALVLERINAHFRKLMNGGGYEPMFQCCCMWNYPVLIASLTLAKATPSIWDQLDRDLQERTDFMMQCFAVAAAFGTDDQNNYSTGPDLYGNYGKEWNPNYRLANVTNILFAVPYFGSADKVNDILLGFDYDSYIAKFEEYNWTAAKAAWSKDAFERSDGTMTTSTKKLMMYGGTAYYGVDYKSIGQYRGNEAGSGVGVRSAYTYQGYTLDQIPGIFNRLLRYNYSGGNVFSSFSQDGKKLAYVLDGSRSPVEGNNGMMLEFNAGDGAGKRVSAGYCMHDFIMIVFSLEAFEELGLYNIEDYYDIFDLAYVGNSDLIFKLEHGFMSYANGSSYENRESWDEGYMLAKKLWNDLFASRYYVETEARAESYSPISSNSGTTQSLAPVANGSNLKYDLSVANAYTESDTASYTSASYLIWDFEYLVGATAKETDFYIRDGAANKKTGLLFFARTDGVNVFRFGDAEYPVADGWHRLTFVVNQTNEGQAITLHVTFFLDGVRIGTVDKIPVADEVLYKVDDSGEPIPTPKATWFYIYMSWNGEKRDGFVTLRNSSLGVGSTADALPNATGSVTYVLNGGSFISNGEIVRKAFALSDGTVVPAYTHSYTDVNHYYTVGTLAGNEFAKRAIFLLPDASQVERDGYVLDGWFLDEGLTVPYSHDALSGEAITLYAKWKKDGGFVIFQTGEGKIPAGETVPLSYRVGDDSIALPTPAASLARFDGWFTSPDFSGDCYRDAYTLAPDQCGSITFYAKWTPIGAIIRYLGFDEGVPTGTYDKSYLFGATSVNLPTNVRRGGYKFTGWYTSPDLDPASRIDGFTYAISENSTEELSFYAAFTQTGAKVTFQTTAELSDDYTRYYPLNVASEIDLPTATLPGYTFLGWYTSADFSGEPSIRTYQMTADKALESGITFYGKFVKDAVIDATASGFNYTIEKKRENVSFANVNGTGRFSIVKTGVSDLYFQVFGVGNQLGVYAVEFKLSKQSEDSDVLPLEFRIHSKNGSNKSVPPRSEALFFRTLADGTMTLFYGENAIPVGTVTTTPQTVTLLLDFSSDTGFVSAVCYIDGVLCGEGKMNTNVMTYSDAVALYGENETEAYHYPDYFYFYSAASATGELQIDDFYCGEGYLPTGTGNAYNTKYLQTFGE